MKKNLVIEIVIVLLVALAVVFGITIGFGTLTSGWHLIDEHEVLEWDYYRKHDNISYWQLVFNTVKADSGTRSRYFDYPFKILVFFMVGANPLYMHIVKACETVVAITLLYFIGKKLTDSIAISALFALTCMVGYQGPIWWKYGPPHVRAIIVFSIGFLCLLKWLDDMKYRRYAVISLILCLVAGFFHESFSFLLFFTGCYAVFDAYKKGKLSQKFREPRVIYAIVSFGLLFLYLLSIVIRLGLNSYSAVGVDESTSIISYIKVTIGSLDYDLKWYFRFGIVLTGVLLTFYEELKKYVPEMLIGASIIVPQLILYGKEGISERYLIPLVIGYSLFFVVFMLKCNLMSGNRKKIYIAILILMLGVNAHAMIIEADYYRFRGQGVTHALEEIDELSSKGYSVLCCLGNANPEAEETVYMYLRSKGNKGIYYWDQYAEKVLSGLVMYKSPEAGIPVEDMDIIVAYNRDDRHFEIDPNIDLSEYTLVRTAGIDIYFSKSAQSEVTDELIQKLRVKPTIYGIGA